MGTLPKLVFVRAVLPPELTLVYGSMVNAVMVSSDE